MVHTIRTVVERRFFGHKVLGEVLLGGTWIELGDLRWTDVG